jgi:site-specific DNA recombinase
LLLINTPVIAIKYVSKESTKAGAIQLKILQARLQEQNHSAASQLQELKKELTDNQAGAQRLYEAVERGLLPLDETLESRSHALKAKRQELLVQIARSQTRCDLPTSELAPRKVAEFGRALAKRLKDGIPFSANGILRRWGIITK